MPGFKTDFATVADNSTANETINDVIGSKSDRAFSNLNPSGSDDPSLVGHLVAN